MSLKVCFYDFTSDSLVFIEDWQDDPESITLTSVLMAQKYQSGKHSMPSYIWVAFDSNDVLRVFYLDEDPQVDEVVLSRIKFLVGTIICES